MMQISDRDFQRLTAYIQSNFGIDLTKKRQLINSRLSTTITAQGFDSFTPFIDQLLSRSAPQDVEIVLNKLTTNYTYFMREKDHYDFFQRVILPDIIQRNQSSRSLAIWSAGCSSGEEPYNLSMYVLDYLGAQASHWDTRILATDISQNVLSTAKAGIYDLPQDIPPNWLSRYFQKQADGRFAVCPQLRNNVIFRTFNLMDPIRFRLKFDVIFCRNVMIYFNQPTKNALVQRFYDATKPGGYLLIGHSETIDKGIPYRMCIPAAFQKPR